MSSDFDFNGLVIDAQWDAAEDACPVVERDEDGTLVAFTANICKRCRQSPDIQREAHRRLETCDDWSLGMASAAAAVQWLRRNSEHSYLFETVVMPGALEIANDPDDARNEFVAGFLGGLFLELAHSKPSLIEKE